MNKLKTLIIVTPGFPANEDDSTCLPPQQVFVRALQEADSSLKVIVLTIEYPFFSSSYKWNGVKVISFGGKNKTKLFRLVALFKIWLTLSKLKKKNNIIGLLSFWLDKSALIADRFAKRNDLPHFCWLLGQDAKIGNKYVKLMKPKAESLIALSDFIAREFEQNYNIIPKNIISVGIDAKLFAPNEFERSIDVLGVGSLISLKQYHLFLAVIEELRFIYPKIKVLICGDGPEMNSLHQLIIKSDLVAQVSLMGSLPHNEILMLMQKSKLFLHTANYEGFGAVNLEALYAGAKVISFVKPMHVGIENWYHVNDLQEMITLSKEILADPFPVYKKVMPFTISNIAKRMLALYDHTIDPIS